MSRLGGEKPSILLFIGGSDAESCCAKNFERTIFRDAGVVKLAEESFLAVRVDRETDAAKTFVVTQPSIVIQDNEGEEVARFLSCTQPAWVLEILNETLVRCKEIKARGAEVAPRIARLEKLLADGRYRDACPTLLKVQKVTPLSRALRDKLAAIAQSVGDLAAPRLALAAARDAAGDPGQAWTVYRSVRDDFWGLAPSNAAKAAMAVLEKDPEKKDKLREGRAQAALDGARDLADAGRKDDAQGELHRLVGEFDGTQAAEAARAFAKELLDPSWKPAPRPPAEKPAPDEPAPDAQKADPPAAEPGAQPTMPCPPPPETPASED